VPRKPERFGEVAALIEQSGLPFTRFSEIKEKNINAHKALPVILVDTMGDLKQFYALASVVFVGRSLAPMGGSDMMESAALGKCTIFGPHTFNFKQTVEALLDAGGAIEVKDPRDLLSALQKCLKDPQYARIIAANGQAVIRQNQGATEKALQAVKKVLGKNL
jgi:3-deoxy-D-manno-octulosonic-acid transferase